ncbi:MAG: hypothetical protein AB4058_00175 [Microcystaceae cyanobacterium]
MSSFFPKIKPLKRLNVINGLEMTVERWKMAHQYHRQRQNIYYKSLHQGGIVCGLGVWVIPPPSDVSTQYDNWRWLQIQPGIAIDHDGNIIVVPQPMDFYIASQLNSSSSRLIYLVIRYIDPEQLQIQNLVEINETFQIDEKNQPPTDGEIELCRIFLAGDNIRLKSPSNSFAPTRNTLDLRYRQPAQSKPLALIEMGVLQGDATQEMSGLNRLLSSIRVLYPALEGAKDIQVISSLNSDDSEENFTGEVIYLTDKRSQKISSDEFNFLKTYLKKGGLIWLSIPTENTKIEELQIVEQELTKELQRLKSMNKAGDKSKEAETALQNTQEAIRFEIEQMMLNIRSFAERLGIVLESWEQLSLDHPLKSEPFLFQHLPMRRQNSLELFYGDGLVVTIGNFIEIFDLNYGETLSRETLRTFQEFAINILYFAHRKKQMQQALNPN